MEMPRPDNVPAEWDFYPCRVDDAAASIYLNMWFRPHAPIAEAPTLYWCEIRMVEPDSHGMGSSGEAEVLWPIEDSIGVGAAAIGLYAVGRLRNLGSWWLYYYGPPDLEPSFERTVQLRSASMSEREVDIGCQDDPSWKHYCEFLYPDEERRSWIGDRNVVDNLSKHGDDGSTPREIDHWIYFASAADRDRFLDVIDGRGFQTRSTADDGAGKHAYSLQIYRTDAADLDTIHSVCTDLRRAAESVGGDYDGW